MWLSNKAYMQRSTGVAPRISLSAWQWKAVLCSSGEWNDQSVVDHQRRGEKLSLDLDKRTHMVPSKWRPLWLTTICNMPGQSWSKQDSECGKKEERNAFFFPLSQPCCLQVEGNHLRYHFLNDQGLFIGLLLVNSHLQVSRSPNSLRKAFFTKWNVFILSDLGTRAHTHTQQCFCSTFPAW